MFCAEWRSGWPQPAAAAAPPAIDELIDGVVARSTAVYQAQIDFTLTERHGPTVETAQQVRSDRYELSVAGPDWLLRYADSPNLIMKHDAVTLRYYETPSRRDGVDRSLHIDAPQTLDNAVGENAAYTSLRHGTFWYPAQATYVDRQRGKAQLVEEQRLAGVNTYVLQWQVDVLDFDEALIVIPPRIAKQRKGYLRIHVAPDLGFALPRIEYRAIDDETVKRFESSDFVQVDSDIYYPRSSQCITRHADQSFLTDFQVHDIRHVNQKLPGETFTLQIPARTRMRDSRPGLPTTVLVLDQPLHLDELETTLHLGSPVQSRSLLRVVCFILNAVAVLSLIVLWLRKRTLPSAFVALATATCLIGPAATIRAATPPEFTWPEVQARIDQHRSQLRLCGPLSAMRALSLLGHRVDPQDILQRCRGLPNAGMRVQQVIDLCREFDRRTRAVVCPAQDLRMLTTPCILLVNQGQHCVVLETIQGRSLTAVIWDPSDLKSKGIPFDTLRQMWSGQAIVFGRATWSSSALVCMTAGSTTFALVQWLCRRRSAWSAGQG